MESCEECGAFLVQGRNDCFVCAAQAEAKAAEPEPEPEPEGRKEKRQAAKASAVPGDDDIPIPKVLGAVFAVLAIFGGLFAVTQFAGDAEDASSPQPATSAAPTSWAGAAKTFCANPPTGVSGAAPIFEAAPYDATAPFSAVGVVREYDSRWRAADADDAGLLDVAAEIDGDAPTLVACLAQVGTTGATVCAGYEGGATVTLATAEWDLSVWESASGGTVRTAERFASNNTCPVIATVFEDTGERVGIAQLPRAEIGEYLLQFTGTGRADDRSAAATAGAFAEASLGPFCQGDFATVPSLAAYDLSSSVTWTWVDIRSGSFQPGGTPADFDQVARMKGGRADLLNVSLVLCLRNVGDLVSQTKTCPVGGSDQLVQLQWSDVEVELRVPTTGETLWSHTQVAGTDIPCGGFKLGDGQYEQFVRLDDALIAAGIRSHLGI